MAMSNRERVGRGFELLAEGLNPFVDRIMRKSVPDGDWITALRQRGPKNQTLSPTDPNVLLRVLVEFRDAFEDDLSRTEQNFAVELRETRHRWAHNNAFSSDDTSRALDTMERLLTAAGASQQAEQLRRTRMEHQRAAVEADNRQAAKAAAATPLVEGLGIKPWREVITPHTDVAAGNLNAAEFVADLGLIARGEGSEEYADPVRFFGRTYLTEGLQDLLTRAVRRIGGDTNAAPVLNLQTTFGGGKTHSMLALYHLFSGHPVTSLPEEMEKLLPDTDLGRLGSEVRRVTLVGHHLSAASGMPKDDGTLVNTIWGELAWQLGGQAAYRTIAQDDASGTSPGHALHELIAAHAPCLILIDEWVSYARQLYGDDSLRGGNFDAQFTFAQTLTEAVRAVPGALLVVSIPASDEAGTDSSGGAGLEVGGPNGQEALRRLQHVVRRVADQWRPATATESFEIVRRRLFEEPSDEAQRDIAAVARQFGDFYRQHSGELPRECGEPAYEARIRAAYPIHPELFDRLYEDWSTLDRFQRTRGVLRLMSTVIHAMWTAGDTSPLITPGTVPLNVPTVLGEITQYLEDQWKPVVDVDIDGPESTPVEIDRERKTFGQRSLTRRLARAVFLGSAATLKSAHKGIDRQRLSLGVAIPGDTLGNFGSALHLLQDRATYLYTSGERYWYDTQPSIARTARDYAERLREHPEEVHAEIVRRLREQNRHRGDFAGVHVAPQNSADLPDTDEARLVVLHPQDGHRKGATGSAAMEFADEALARRGTVQRERRNMLVFLAPDARELEDLEDAAREFLAWDDICGRTTELDLSPTQTSQSQNRRYDADEAVSTRIGQTYVWTLVSVQPDAARQSTWEAVKAEGAAERLAERVSAKLRQSDLLRVQHAPQNIRRDLDGPLERVWSKGHLAVGELWGYHTRYPYLARLRDRSVLDAGVAQVLDLITWEREGFALANGYDKDAGRYDGLVLPHERVFGQITDATLLVAPGLATEQRRAELAQRPEAETAGGGDGTEATTGAGADGAGGGEVSETTGGTATGTRATGPARPSNTRFFGVYKLNTDRHAKDFRKLSDEIIPHLADEDTELEIRVEIHAHNKDGFDESTVRTVSENARTLKFEQSQFEDT